MLRDSAEDYRRAGHPFQAAWEILARGCDIPPSLELFNHELAVQRRSNATLSEQGLARRLAESYHRVQGFFGDDG